MDDKLKLLQNTIKSILVDVVEFCDKHNIKYCMMYGSAIGAVRHHGFIPWDDDLDIAMPIQEMNRFVKLWKASQNDKYVLQEIGDNSHINHMKVILKDSPFIIEDAEDGYDGVFLDIFPVYKVKKNKTKSFVIWNAIRIVYTRGFVTKKFGKGIYLVSWCMLKLIPKGLQKKILNYSRKYIEKYENLDMKDCYMVEPATVSSSKEFYDFDIFKKLEKVDFEGIKVNISYKNHEILTKQFGDYMQFPPESERVCLHNLVLKEDVEHAKV